MFLQKRAGDRQAQKQQNHEVQHAFRAEGWRLELLHPVADRIRPQIIEQEQVQLDAVGIHQRRRRASHAEQAVAHDVGLAARTHRAPQQPFDATPNHQQSQERKQDEEAAMQVGPQDHARNQQPECAGPAPAVSRQQPERDRGEEQRENVRPGVEMDGARVDGHQNQRQRDDEICAAPQRVQQQNRERGRNHRAGEKHDAFESGECVQRREDHFRQPLERVPFAARLRESKKIVRGDGAVRQDVIADSDVRPDVAIHEQALPSVLAQGEGPGHHRYEEQVGQGRDEKSKPAARCRHEVQR